MARKPAYKIVLLNAKGKKIKGAKYSQAHFIEIWYGKKKILKKSPLPKVYFTRKKRASDKKSYIKRLIVTIEKKRVKALLKRKKTLEKKKKLAERKKRKAAIRKYRNRRAKKAQKKAKKVRITKRQKKTIKEIQREPEPEIESEEFTETADELPKIETTYEPIEYEDYTKAYSSDEFFSKRFGKNIKYDSMKIIEKVPIAVDRDNIDIVVNEMRQRYFPHFYQHIKSFGRPVLTIPKFEFLMDITEESELQVKKIQRLKEKLQAVSVQRTEITIAQAKLLFEELIEHFITVMTGRTGSGTNRGGNYLARSQNGTIYITGFTTETNESI